MTVQLNYRVVVLIFVWILLSSQYISVYSKKEEVKKIKIAFCVTGQLARLELESKLKNVVLPNLQIGHTVHLYILLDNEVQNVKQTFWKFDYSNTPFVHFDVSKLSHFIKTHFDKSSIYKDNQDNFKYFIRLEKPANAFYQLVGNVYPVPDKIIHRPNPKIGSANPKDDKEPAPKRFQNNMRWLGGLRDCVKWVQYMEFKQRMFYDLVVRLRDDSYAFDKWYIRYEFFGHRLTSTGSGSYGGINDHNFVIDREYADILFRGLIEDYYLNDTLKNETWFNPEHHIYRLAETNNIVMQNSSVCQQPLIPLRGLYNETHWLLHAYYIDLFAAECNTDGLVYNKYLCVCREQWYDMLDSNVVPIKLNFS